MVEIFNPKTTDSVGLTEFAPDATAAGALIFFHASQGKPLATPWQVALARSNLLTQLSLPDGYILDCACGSGIQLGAHMALLQRPGIGVEIDVMRAQASAVNLQSIAVYRNERDSARMQNTRIIAGDGRDGAAVCAAIADHLKLEQFPNIALLHLDPARPRNSRTHGLEEMAPRLDEVFTGWAPYLAEGKNGPALLLDLSPRLTHAQRLEVESMVDEVWSGINRTWVWTSRGRGRVDRLALWLGSAATAGVARRFVRIPPSIAEETHVISGGIGIGSGDGMPTPVRQPPRRGERVSILDAALVESGLADEWLNTVTKSEHVSWSVIEGRRPQIHHQHALRLERPMDRMLVQATGRVVALARIKLGLETVDKLVELILEHDIAKMTVRVPLAPEIQPKIQGAIDRQLAKRHGKREAFLVQQPGDEMLLICIAE